MEFKDQKIINNSININQVKYISPKNMKNKNNLKQNISKIIICFSIFLLILIFSNFKKSNDNLNLLKYNKKLNITAINYANLRFKNSQKLNSFSAIKYGNVNQTIEYNQENISSSFFEANREILSMERGGGYWLWKPYFISKSLIEKVKYNDYLIYSDSGSIYINSVYNLLSVMIRDKIDIMSFHLTFKQKEWTKRDAFLLLNCDTPKYTESNQILASFIFMKNTNYSRSIINEWLKFAQDKRIITDQPNVLGKPNYLGFRENRHDQSIFSLLITKYNLPSYRDPSNWGLFEYDAKSTFPTIFYHTRNGNFTSLKDIIESGGFKEYNSKYKKMGNFTLQNFADSVINN